MTEVVVGFSISATDRFVIEMADCFALADLFVDYIIMVIFNDYYTLIIITN